MADDPGAATFAVRRGPLTWPPSVTAGRHGPPPGAVPSLIGPGGFRGTWDDASSHQSSVPMPSVTNQDTVKGQRFPRREMIMTRTQSPTRSHVGEVVSLIPLGRTTMGRVVSQSWSPALGAVLRVSEDLHGQPGPTMLLYGELLSRVHPAFE